MTDETEAPGNDHPGKPKPLPVWKPWTPPVNIAAPPPPPPIATTGPSEGGTSTDAGSGGSRRPRMVTDANTLGGVAWKEVRTPELPPLDFDKMNAAANPSAKMTRAETAAALGELGVVGTLSQVAVAFSLTTFDPQALAASLHAFAANLGQVADQVNKIPGVGNALHALGGIGGIVSGTKNLADALGAMRRDGPGLANGLAAAAGAAKLVGGVALALSPLAPPLAAIGTSITLAGAALELGKLGWENRDVVRSAANKAGKVLADGAGLAGQAPIHGTGRLATAGASAGGTPIVGNNGSAFVANNSAAIVANNSAAMVKQPFGWLTG